MIAFSLNHFQYLVIMIESKMILLCYLLPFIHLKYETFPILKAFFYKVITKKLNQYVFLCRMEKKLCSKSNKLLEKEKTYRIAL